MLKRRPIRIKLLVALTLLSAIVLLLAFSGIWGLYQYRPVSDAIRQRTEQLRSAGELRRHATSLQESFARLKQSAGPTGMIEDSSLIDNQQLSESEFDLALWEFPLELDKHDTVLNSPGLSSLVNVEQQALSLESIAKTFDTIRSTSNEKGLLETKDELQRQLASLDNQTQAHLQTIEAEMAKISQYVDQQYHTWIAMALTCSILAVLMVPVLLWLSHSLVVKPFRTLLDGSRLVAGGQFDHRIDLGTGDELSELANAMNHMTDQFQGALAQVKSWCTDLDRQVQQRTREVIQNEQLASVGFLAAGVAHEINNPLATIAWSAESLQSRWAEVIMTSPADRQLDDELCEVLTTNLRRIEDEAYRCKGITEKLLDFSRLNEVRRVPTDLSDLVGDVISMVGKVGKFRCKTIKLHADEPVIAEVNPQEIRQVVLNLVTNALESVATNGRVDVTCQTRDGHAQISVEDNGCGMSREVQQHLFEPFFTRRSDGTGTGLGLSITYRIVSQHGGTLNAHSEGEGHGSQLNLALPLVPNEDAQQPPTIHTRPALESSSKVA
ncbi:MAG: ATP-binding protein [Rubripirellula sp.]|nr:ATP-binding protein [Rubripirellula sp.]